MEMAEEGITEKFKYNTGRKNEMMMMRPSICLA
jgi:hypothetical protein